MALEDTRNKILTVADKLFSRFGFHKTSMDEIAKISRKAKGSLYYHFASKEELFTAVVSTEIENLKTQLSIIVNDKSLRADEKIKRYLVKRMEILNTAANYHETLKADFFEHFSFIDLLDVFIMVLKGLEIPFFLQDKYNDLHPYFDDLLKILIKGLGK